MSGFFDLEDENHKSKILIVDDDLVLPNIIRESHLMSAYEIISVQDGNKALEILNFEQPELFLLDYNMPVMTGVELCKQLKSYDQYKEIPVIFLTGVKETRGIVEAFQVGAVDYIIKPVVLEELALRAKTHIGFYRAKNKLEEFAMNMEKLAEERAKQLMHADRLATLGTLSAGLAHEIKNPATFISGNIQTMERFWEVLKDIIPFALDKFEDKKVQLQFIHAEVPGLLTGIKDGVSRIRKVVDSLKAFSRKGTHEKEPFAVADRIINSLMLCKKLLKDNVVVKKTIPEEELIVKGDPQQIEQVLVNLFVNANDAMEGRSDSCLAIAVEKNDSNVDIYIDDNGPGISQDKLTKIWEPFFTTKPAGKGTGLGLPLCRTMIERNGGRLGVENRKTGGVRFRISLPLYKE